jgi:hypothetical protein
MAETKTMLPVIEAFMTAHQLPDVTIARGRGHDLRGQQEGDRGRRLSFILGMGIPHAPTWSRSGAASIPARRSPAGTSSPSHGRRADQHMPVVRGDHELATGSRAYEVVPPYMSLSTQVEGVWSVVISMSSP